MTKNRRKFIKDSLLATMAMSIGTNVVFGNNLPKGMELVGLDKGSQKSFPGKSNLLTVLNDRPINMETPAHLLNDALTPNNLFFVRNKAQKIYLFYLCNNIISFFLEEKNKPIKYSNYALPYFLYKFLHPYI